MESASQEYDKLAIEMRGLQSDLNSLQIKKKEIEGNSTYKPLSDSIEELNVQAEEIDIAKQNIVRSSKNKEMESGRIQKDLNELEEQHKMLIGVNASKKNYNDWLKIMVR